MEFIAVRGLDSASPANVHEHLLRARSKELSDSIDVAIEDVRKSYAEREIVSITISLNDTAMRRWSVWLYGQPFHKGSENLDRVVVDICEIHQFSMRGGDHECANACIDTIREIIAHDYDKLTVDLGTFLHFLAAEPKAVQMLVDLLVYGPTARSGKTREWLYGTRAEEKWAHFFHQLSLTSAKRLADEAALHPDIMAQHAYHIADKDTGTCCGAASGVI